MNKFVAFRIRLFALPLTLLGALSSGAAGYAGQADPSNPVVAEVGGDKIFLNDFLLYLKEMKPRSDFWRFSEDQRKAVVEEFVQRKLWALQAKEKGVEDDAAVRARVDFLTDGTLGQAVRQRIFDEIQVSEEELADYYEKHREQFKAPPRFRIQHLLYKSKKQAEQARNKLESGADFSRLAAEKGKDPDLLIAESDWFSPQLLIPELAQAAEKLEKGQTAPVIRSSYGHHALRMKDREPGGQLTLEQVRSQVELKVRQEKAAEAYGKEMEAASQRHGAEIFPEALAGSQPPR